MIEKELKYCVTKRQFRSLVKISGRGQKRLDK